MNDSGPAGAGRSDSALPEAWTTGFPHEATPSESFGLLTVDVAPEDWVAALRYARDDLACGFFDWLTAVDELADGFGIVVHLHSLERRHHQLVRTRVSRADPRLPTATGVYRGAAWHERETHEMFGVVFDGHPDLRPLLLPDGFEGHPLRKEFVLAARVAKPWPGAKEPGESAAGAPSRRRMLPPGVPADWGPQAAPQVTSRGGAGAGGPGGPPAGRRDRSPGGSEAAPSPEAARDTDLTDLTDHTEPGGP